MVMMVVIQVVHVQVKGVGRRREEGRRRHRWWWHGWWHQTSMTTTSSTCKRLLLLPSTWIEQEESAGEVGHVQRRVNQLEARPLQVGAAQICLIQVGAGEITVF